VGSGEPHVDEKSIGFKVVRFHPSRIMVTKRECIVSLQEAAEVLGHSPSMREYRQLGLNPGTSTIEYKFDSWNNAKEEAGISTVPPNDEKSPSFRTTVQGYEEVRTRTSEGLERVSIHRLLAVSEHGFDAVSDMDIHHESDVGWDNRPENLSVLTHSEHSEITRS
jgi:hypothetical protein